MKAYVRIQSKVNIGVTCGLQYKNVTNPDAHIPDRLKINPSWSKLTIDILEGSHYYPSEIVEWNTVKRLQQDKILTIGEFTDEPEFDLERAKQLKEELNRKAKSANIDLEPKETKKRKVKTDKVEDINLDSLANGE